MRLTMLCLVGFELSSRWVPLSQSPTNPCHLASSFNATAKQTLKGLIWGSTSPEELKLHTI